MLFRSQERPTIEELAKEFLINTATLKNTFKGIYGQPMQKRWNYFLKTIKDDSLEFSVVIEEMQKFLEPVFEAIVNEDEWQGEWESNISRWSHLGGGIDHDNSS